MAGGGGGYSGYSNQNSFNKNYTANGKDHSVEGGDKLSCNCENICIVTILNSPQEDVLASLNIGDILCIKEEAGKLLATKNGKIAGSLTPPEQAKVISCIGEGYEYIAEVIEKTGAACKVQIKPKVS